MGAARVLRRFMREYVAEHRAPAQGELFESGDTTSKTME